MDDRVEQLEKRIQSLEDLLINQQFGRDNFTSVDILRKNFKHSGSKLGFYGGDLVSQPADLGVLGINASENPTSTIWDITGSGSDININSNFVTLATRYNNVRTTLRSLGLME